MLERTSVTGTQARAMKPRRFGFSRSCRRKTRPPSAAYLLLWQERGEEESWDEGERGEVADGEAERVGADRAQEDGVVERADEIGDAADEARPPRHFR